MTNTAHQPADAPPLGDAREQPLPAWPVLALLWGFPVWWAFGLSTFAPPLMAVPMLALLVHRREVALPPGVLPLIGFAVWVVPCVLMLDSGGRLIGYLVRLSGFVAVCVVTVYVCNARNSLPPRRLLAGLCVVWVSVVVGGYLGLLFPEGRLSWTVGRLLPGAIVANDYVSDLVFPAFAEIQLPYGADEPFLRPAAPFAYTNGWGAAFALLTPVVVAFVIEYGRRRTRVWLGIALLLAVPPAVATTNRGMLLTLVVCVVYVAVRLVGRGHWKPFLLTVVGGIVGLVVLRSAGFFSAVSARQETVNTTEGRGSLYDEAFRRALESPILGYGAPRPSYTSEITVGTQGMLWSLMFCFGFVGLTLFLLFLLGGLVRTWRAPSTATLVLHGALVSVLPMLVYYGLDRHLLAIATILGLLLRERYADSSSFWRSAPETAR